MQMYKNNVVEMKFDSKDFMRLIYPIRTDGVFQGSIGPSRVNLLTPNSASIKSQPKDCSGDYINCFLA